MTERQDGKGGQGEAGVDPPTRSGSNTFNSPPNISHQREMDFWIQYMNQPAEYPVLQARAAAYGTWVIECPYCGKRHTHGAKEGHRVAHCAVDTPESVKGYILKAPQ